MRTGIIFVVAFLLFVSTAIEAKQSTSMVVTVSWDISLDADGHVTKLATKDESMPTLHAPLEKAIRGWHFSPGTINGQPAATESHVQTRLELRLVKDAYQVWMLGADTGASYGKTPPPEYPDAAAKAWKQGEVVLIVHYNGTGAVTDVAPYEHGPKAYVQLARAAMTAVKNWTFNPEVVGGHPIPGVALVPVCFALPRGTPPACQWESPATGRNMNGSQAVALNPAAKLESDVIGRVL